MPGRKNQLTRRAAIKKFALGGTALLTASVTGRASGQSRSERAPVWLDMDQEALNDAYSQSNHAPNIAQVIDRYRSNSELVRRRLGAPLKLRYGDDPVETLDVYAASQPDAPVHIFIHGGAWQQGTAETYGFPAELFVNAGVHYVVPDFSWVQDVGDSLYPIADQLRRSIAWIYRNADQFGGDAEQMYLSGHSSGAHLAGVMLTTDWAGEFGLPADIFKGGMCCSGIFDLRPVRLSHRSEYIAFTDEMEHDLSPIRHIDRINTPIVVAFGSYETREFKRQSREFADAIATAGKPVDMILAENYNHFEVIETLANPNGILGRAALAQLG
jgi:arylformamidase